MKTRTWIALIAVATSLVSGIAQPALAQKHVTQRYVPSGGSLYTLSSSPSVGTVFGRVEKTGKVDILATYPNVSGFVDAAYDAQDNIVFALVNTDEFDCGILFFSPSHPNDILGGAPLDLADGFKCSAITVEGDLGIAFIHFDNNTDPGVTVGLNLGGEPSVSPLWEDQGLAIGMDIDRRDDSITYVDAQGGWWTAPYDRAGHIKTKNPLVSMKADTAHSIWVMDWNGKSNRIGLVNKSKRTAKWGKKLKYPEVPGAWESSALFFIPANICGASAGTPAVC